MADQHHQAWWRSAAIYQVYLRSFADGNGDGVGDLAGPALETAVPGRPRRRRDLDHAVVPVAARRRRLRRRRLPRRRPDLRHPRRRREADRRGATRSASASSSTSSPTTAPTSTPGSGRPSRRGPARPSGTRFCFRHGRGAGRRAAAEQLAVDLRRPAPGPGYAEARRRVVPAPVRARAARPELGATRRSRARLRGRAAVLARPGRRRLPHRRRAAPLQGRRAARLPDPATSARRRTRSRTARDPRRVPRRGARSADGTPARRGSLVGEVWLPDTGALRPLPAARRAAPGVQLRLPRLPLGRRRLRACIDETLAAHAPLGATATWVLKNHDVTRTSPATAADTTSSSPRSARLPPDLELGRAGPARPRC